MRVIVYGLWHLGCVTAACLAAAGKQVVGLDPDRNLVESLARGVPPIQEPGLAELIVAGRDAGCLSFTSDAGEALRDADVLWVTFDTPVDAGDRADVGFVRDRLQAVRDAVRPGTLVLVSSQVPVGFTRALARDWEALDVGFGYSPENLRLGNAIAVFQDPERIVVGLTRDGDRPRVAELLLPRSDRILWMSVESAEMTKHAVNAFLATSVSFINELARLCEKVGADAREVERGLKTEGRIGPRAYLTPGPAFAGGTLARDLCYLASFGDEAGVETPLVDGVLASNAAHQGWSRDRIAALLEGVESPVAAVLGLTYKPGTNTLRRSWAVELCGWLSRCGVRVQAYDPAIPSQSEELPAGIDLYGSAEQALRGADLVVVATEWPEFRALRDADLAGAMRRPRVVDQTWFLEPSLGSSSRVEYFAPGRAGRHPRG